MWYQFHACVTAVQEHPFLQYSGLLIVLILDCQLYNFKITFQSSLNF
jgi:hypothetical protein